MVFVSHSSKNKIIVDELVEILEKSGIKCWVAPRDVIGGIDYASQLIKAIRECKVFFLVVSEAINKSDQVLNEVEIAVNNGKIILPFKIDDSSYNDSYQYYLSRKHWIDGNPAPSEHHAELVQTIRYFLEAENVLTDTADDKHLIAIRERNRRELIKSTSEKRLSFGMSIQEDDKFNDEYHFYEHIYRYDIIDKDTGKYISYRWLKITNKSEVTTSYIFHKECGENKINFADMKFKAKRLGEDGGMLIVEPQIEIQPNFVQAVKIYFDKPLLPNQTLEIFYRIEWPGESLAYYTGELSTSISLTRYLKGVGALKFAIMKNQPLYGFELEEIDNNFSKKLSSKAPREFVCEEIKEFKSLHDKGFAGAEFYIEDVKDCVSYRIIYKQRDNEIKDDDEDFI